MDGLMHLLRVLSSTSHIKICDFIHSSSQRSLQYPSNWYCYYITCFYCIGQQFFLTFLLYIWEMDKCMLKQRANCFFPLVFLRSVFGWNTSKYRTFVIAATRTHKRSSFSKCCSLASHQHTHHLNFSLIQPLVLPLVQSHDRWRVYTHMQLLRRMIAAVHGGALSWALLVLPDTAE